MAQFKKGDKVTILSNWDSKGIFYYTHAIVYSCGKKQMVLTDAETGAELGRHFAPDGNMGFGVQGKRIVAGHVGEDEAIAYGREWIAAEIARYAHITSTEYFKNEASSTYKNGILANYEAAKQFVATAIKR